MYLTKTIFFRFKYEVAKGYPKSCKKSRMNRNDRKKENGNEAVNQMEKILVKIEKKKWEEQIKCYNCGKRGHTQKECRRFCFKSGGK